MICLIYIRQLQRSAITGPTGVAGSVRVDAPASIAIYDRVFASQGTQVPRSYNASQRAAGNSTIYPLDRSSCQGRGQDCPMRRLPSGEIPMCWPEHAQADRRADRSTSGDGKRHGRTCFWGAMAGYPLRAVDQMVIRARDGQCIDPGDRTEIEPPDAQITGRCRSADTSATAVVRRSCRVEPGEATHRSIMHGVSAFAGLVHCADCADGCGELECHQHCNDRARGVRDQREDRQASEVHREPVATGAPISDVMTRFQITMTVE
jgi:hypothetical protein